MRCGRHGGRRFCNGPRRAPKPHGPAAARAERLDLGTHATGAKLLRSAPYRRWRDALAKLDLSAPEELLWPVRDGPFGRGFGRQQGKMHEGIDVGAERGEPVLAVADGLVAYADNSIRGYGNLLIVLHGGTSVGAYAHLSEIRVFPGQLIERGQVVGEVGNTGISRGDHLHFELHERGEPVDPAYRFER
jgi:murein DD-endopeptidase MepM/ murein hydrolase activator NlpD